MSYYLQTDASMCCRVGCWSAPLVEALSREQLFIIASSFFCPLGAAFGSVTYIRLECVRGCIDLI